MAIAISLGPALLPALEAFPSSVLGVLLALSGVELAACCRDTTDKYAFTIMLIGAGCVLSLGTGVAFVAAALAALAFRISHGDLPALYAPIITQSVGCAAQSAVGAPESL